MGKGGALKKNWIQGYTDVGVLLGLWEGANGAFLLALATRASFSIRNEYFSMWAESS